MAETINRYSMLPRGMKVAVAVSGGPDSVCLLHVLRELAPAFGITLSVIHLNHGLRGSDSDADAAFVGDLATSLSLPFVMEKTDVRSRGGNLEQAGRRARLEFFASVIASGAADRVATGHTASDQAETVVMRLMRGSGTAGLAGIHPVTAGGIIRPLIGCTRAMIEDYLQRHRYAARNDVSNTDFSFLRNRVRHDILPRMKQENPNIEGVLTQLASLAADEESYWHQQVQASGLVSSTIPVAALAREHPALIRRVLRACIRQAKGDLRGIDANHVEQVFQLATRADFNGKATLPGIAVTRSLEWLHFATIETNPAFATEIRRPGEWPLGPREKLRLELIDISGSNAEKVYTEGSWLVDAGVLTMPLLLRGWIPGDRISLSGGNERKLKSLFQKARVPLWERASWPVLVSDGRIVWTKGFGVAKEFAANPETRAWVRITIEPVVSTA